jgi:hypothetical protein
VPTVGRATDVLAPISKQPLVERHGMTTRRSLRANASERPSGRFRELARLHRTRRRDASPDSCGA